MSQFNIDEIEKRTLSGLKDFQRATVERVDYLFRHNQNRVLVADEVGMGKTLIARGAIVKTARLISPLSIPFFFAISLVIENSRSAVSGEQPKLETNSFSSVLSGFVM